jgi:hypothetical protein
MSDPIVVDDAVKVPPSGSKPAAAPPPKPEPAKADPAAAKSPGPFPPPKPAAAAPASWLGKLAEFVGIAPTRRNAAIAASAVFSLAAGVAAVKMMWPTGAGQPPSADQPLTAQASKPTPAEPATPPASLPAAQSQPTPPLAPPAPLAPEVAAAVSAPMAPPAPAVTPVVPNTPPTPLAPPPGGGFGQLPSIPMKYGPLPSADVPALAALAPTAFELLSRASFLAGVDQRGFPLPPVCGPRPLLPPELRSAGFSYRASELIAAAPWRTGLYFTPTPHPAAGPAIAAQPPAATTSGTGAAAPPAAAPLPPPSVHMEVAGGPVPPRVAPDTHTRPASNTTQDPHFRTAAGTDAVKPASPAALPPPDPVVVPAVGNLIPPLPVMPVGGDGPKPTTPPTSGTPLPAIPTVSPTGPMTPTAPATPPAGPANTVPPPAGIDPKFTAPLVPGPTGPTRPDLPALPTTGGAGQATAVPPPSSVAIPPAGLTPPVTPGATPPPPLQGSPVGAVKPPDTPLTPSLQPDPAGSRLQISKPADSATPVAGPAPFPAGPSSRPANAEVRPVTAERPATTSFDVDVYEPRAGDSYETIAREFYNDTRYARALQEYNARRPVQPGRSVDIPPMAVLRQRYSGVIGSSATPASRPTSGTVPTGEWGPATTPKPTTDSGPTFRPAGGGSQTFQVPPGGMSLKAVARQTLGSDQRWSELYELNPQVGDPNAVPAGTVLKLPADARTSQ